VKATPLLTFCVYDAKAELYHPSFTAMNRAVAHRQFETAVSQEGHEFNLHADDYSLWETGTFDQDEGINEDNKNHVNVVNAHHIVAKLNNQMLEVASG